MDDQLDRWLGSRKYRWWSAVALLALAVILIVLPTSSAEEGAHNRIAGFVLLGLGVLFLFYAIVREVQRWPLTRLTRLYERRAQQAIRAGRALPLPPMPEMPQVESWRHALNAIEVYTYDLMTVPWGQATPAITGPDLRGTFDAAMNDVAKVTGMWSQLDAPARVFARMPTPWCYIGAAAVMTRISYLSGGVHGPFGLRQSLRFLAIAQEADPDNVDALLARASALAGFPDPRWLRMAEDTLRRVQQLAPDHPRLPIAEAKLFTQFGEHDKALIAFDRAIAFAHTPDARTTARDGKALALLSLKRPEEAALEYASLVRDVSDNPWIWHNYSIVLYRLERYDEALDASERALAIMPFVNAFERREMIRKKLAERSGVPQR